MVDLFPRARNLV